MTDLPTRLTALESAIEAARGRLDADQLGDAAEVIEHASARLRLSDVHTVVALGGATGSGKSSMFNALARLDVAGVGVLRPTTSTTLACAWGPAGANALLDWIGIPVRDRIARRSLLDPAQVDDGLDGLLLLDLPDHDSVVAANQLEVDRVVEFADLFVWVLDPQKYADAAIHHRYLEPLAEHRETTVVVMNQVDRLRPADRDIALADLRRILEEEGLGGVPVFATSTTTGEGIDELRGEIGRRIKAKSAAVDRLSADVRLAAARLATAGGTAPAPGLGGDVREQLIDTFATCVGVPQIADAVAASVSRRAALATDWPLLSWWGRLRRDPLAKMGLGKQARDLVASRIPIEPSVQRSRADLALRDAAQQATEGLSRPWRTAMLDAVNDPAHRGVIDELDTAVGETDLGLARRPWWWAAVSILQWLAFGALLGGIGWGIASLAGYASTGSMVLGMTRPVLLVLGALVLGLVLTIGSRLLGAVSARRRAVRAEARLRASIARVTDDVVLARVGTEVDRYERFRSGVLTAGGS